MADKNRKPFEENREEKQEQPVRRRREGVPEPKRKTAPAEDRQMPAEEKAEYMNSGREVNVRPFSRLSNNSMPNPMTLTREQMVRQGLMPQLNGIPADPEATEFLKDQNPVQMQPEQLKTLTDEDVQRAEEILKRYREGKTALEERVKENQKWFRQRSWDVVGRGRSPGSPEPTSAWLFNCIANKHADFMDNYPSPVVLPREPQDKQDAQTLTSVLPVVMEQNNYEQVYDDGSWDLLITGIDVQGVFWDPSKLNGLGDITVKPVDVLNLFWEPGVTDLQKSQNVFHVELRDADELKREYPQLADVSGLNGNNGIYVRYENDENIDDSNRALVVDWYYKRMTESKKTVLHYAKFCAGKLLYASENDPQHAQRGFYDHGKYPYVVSGLFPIKDQLGGFGYVDIMKSPQIYIDKLDQCLLENTVIGSKPRWWVRNDGKVNEKEYADMTKSFVHFTGNGNPQDSIFQIQPTQVNNYSLALRTAKIDELKETSGNRDFSQGGTASGITAASAIAALQEAGSKLSRDMIKERFRAHRQVCELVIELIRQFYSTPRMFRITGKQGATEFVQFSGAQIGMQQTGDAFMQATRLPVFDVEVVTEKSSPFSTVVQNERAKELYAAGFFNPQMADQALMALEMMTFEGIDEIKQKITQNSGLYKVQTTLIPMVMQMATELDQFKGTAYLPQVQMMIQQMMNGGQQPAMPMGQPMGQEPQANGLGAELNSARKSTAGEARKRAANNATPS